jgi:hypothetical protein
MSGNFYLEIDAVDWSAKISTAKNVCYVKELKFFGQIREDAEFKGLYIAGNPEPVDRYVLIVDRHYGPVGIAYLAPKAAARLSDTRKSRRTPC